MKHLLSCLVCLATCAIGGPAWGIPYGLTGILPVWDGPAPTDGIGMRFRFNVADNDSRRLKLIFGSSRLNGLDTDTYLLEYNIYDRGLRYDDGVNTTWPLDDGSLDDFGVALSSYADTPVIEFGNDPASTYLPVDTIIDITPMSVPEPETFYLFITGALALLGSAVRRKPKRLNV